jgi:hypothetical protein
LLYIVQRRQYKELSHKTEYHAIGDKVSLGTPWPLGTLGTTMKNNNTKVDCTTLADQRGLHLPDSAHADLCSQAHADFLYIVMRKQAGSCMGKRGGAARVGVKGVGRGVGGAGRGVGGAGRGVGGAWEGMGGDGRGWGRGGAELV